MAEYLRKSSVFEARRFDASHGDLKSHLDDLVSWLQSHGVEVKHDGNGLDFCYSSRLNQHRVSGGKWMISVLGRGSFSVFGVEAFGRHYEKTMTADSVQAAYEEGFEDGKGNGNIPYNYPPLSIAWLLSEMFKAIGGVVDSAQSAVLAKWRDAKHDERIKTSNWDRDLEKKQ